MDGAVANIVLLGTNDTHSQMEPGNDDLGGIARRATCAHPDQFRSHFVDRCDCCFALLCVAWSMC